MWRYKDPDNHHIVPANALEDNVVLYKWSWSTAPARGWASFPRLQRDLGFTLLYVTHNRDEALALGARLVRMSRRRVEGIEPEAPI